MNWSDTQITSSGAVQIMANHRHVSNQDFVFTMPNPTVTGITPATGPGGTQVQASGIAFGATRGSSSITFGGIYATVASWSDAQILPLVPIAVGNPTPVQVSEGGVPSHANIYFTVPAHSSNQSLTDHRRIGQSSRDHLMT